MRRNTSLIPLPYKISELEGEFVLSSDTTISCQGGESLEIGELLAKYLRPSTGFPLPTNAGQEGSIQIRQTESSLIDEAGFESENYILRVTPAGITLEAPSSTGLARGIQTLRQLFPAEILSKITSKVNWVIPAVDIEDQPRFRWRGLHLDVSRHFFPVECIYRFIDNMAFHRYNICHLHLTDDQGWRIEIKKYPKLTEIGSVRECTLLGHESHRPRRYDNQEYKGFYSQQDIRKIVQFANERRITLLPEIDLPGHMQSAIAAYPELGHYGASLKPRYNWGMSMNILNVEPSTLMFCKNVLDEVMDLFPGKFIHIGGDEAQKQEWSESRQAQERMLELGLSNEHELQSWFIKEMGDHISKAGRRMIGWDEILEGGLAEHATVMSWRNEEGGKKASALGHDVVMAPSQSLYFDYYQSVPKEAEPLAIGGMTTIEKVYAYEPIPEDMTPEHAKHILGSQGQLWTEYMPNMEHVEYMTFPRACALAEVLWSDKLTKNYPEFIGRLKVHRQRLKALGINAHPKP